MARVLCILEGYQSLSEANALCLSPMIRFWESRGHQVDVISIEDCPQAAEETVCPIPKQELLKTKWLRLILKLLYMPLRSRRLARSVESELSRRCSAVAYDAAIAVVNPVEAAEALTRIKTRYPSLKTILYEIDPASNRYKTPKGPIERLWRLRSTRWERKTYRAADWIIHMKTHKAHFSKAIYQAFQEKTLYLDIPSFELDLLPANQRKKNEPIRMVYAGAFYPALRNPKTMFDILWEFSKQTPLVVDIYTGNSMKDQIAEMLRNRETVFRLHPYVSKEVLRSAYQDADILLDLGNLDSDFLSSKVLQYVGTGKPILHFSQDTNDVALPYLTAYQNALVIDMDRQSVSEAVDALCSLSEKCRTPTHPDPDLLSSRFIENTPQYSAEKIMELFYDK